MFNHAVTRVTPAHTYYWATGVHITGAISSGTYPGELRLDFRVLDSSLFKIILRRILEKFDALDKTQNEHHQFKDLESSFRYILKSLNSVHMITVKVISNVPYHQGQLNTQVQIFG